MKKFTHGIVIVKQSDVIKNASVEGGDGIPVIHFIGYWTEPTVDDYTDLMREIRTDESFGLKDIADQLALVPAPKDAIDHFNSVMYYDDKEKTPMKHLLDFICGQELESYEELPILIVKIGEKFDIRNSKDEEATEELINAVMDWEKDPSIYDSLEKTLKNKFTVTEK
jgi:hypothetical protein